MRKEKVNSRKEQVIELDLQELGTDELCPSCGEEITVLGGWERGPIEVACRCGCVLAVA